MKLSIKQQVKKAEESILKDNVDFYNKIVETNFAPKKSRKKPIIISLISTATAMLTLVLCLVFLLPSANAPEKKFYLQANEVIVNTSFEEINHTLKNIKFCELLNYNYYLQRVYDSQYNDDLFYKAIIDNEETFEAITLYFYINKDYTLQQELLDSILTTTKNGFTINYNKYSEVDDDEFYKLNYNAETNINNITIFINYSQLSFEDESNFFNFFEESLKIII